MKTRPETLRNDERGAIMVVAVFMAAFLVGALWYVVGVGNATLFRESMQNGADAAAFSAAVFHARGMNIIAMLNIIMAAILGVLVALKIAYLLLTITAVILDVICAIPTQQWACPLAGFAHTGANTVNSIIKSVEPVINNTLKVLSGLQKVIAKVMPVVALAKSYDMAKQYSKPVDGGLMLSEALIPTDGFGLPVEEDEFSVLCRKAGEFVAEFALSPLGVFGVPTKWASGLVGGLVASAPGYFCGDSGGSSGGGSGSGSGGKGGSSGKGGASNPAANSDAAAKSICDAQKQAVEEHNKNNKKNKQTFDYDECLKEQKKQQKANEASTMGNSNSGSGGKTPKKVIDAARNGNKYFQVLTYAWGDMALATNARQGVKVSAWGKGAMAPPSFWGKIQFAQAEFYYDPMDGPKDWDGIKEDAMWNMQWRARLRRYHKEIAPGGEVVSTAMSLMNVPGGVLEAIDFLQGGGLGDLVGGLIPGLNSDSVSKVYTSQGTKKEGGGFEKIDNSVDLEISH